MLLSVLTYPDPFLKTVARNVELFDGELAQFCEDLAETMYVNDGVGLAATQVGDDRKIFVVDETGEGKSLLTFVNPLVFPLSMHTVMGKEGCLSIPEKNLLIERHENIRVTAQDATGRKFSIDASGYLSRIIQHENDHLRGITMLDRISK